MKQTTTSRHCRRGHGERQPGKYGPIESGHASLPSGKNCCRLSSLRARRVRAARCSQSPAARPRQTARRAQPQHSARRWLRRALESLARSSSKFGQVLSTRPDLIPPDIASELAAAGPRATVSAEDVRRVLEPPTAARSSRCSPASTGNRGQRQRGAGAFRLDPAQVEGDTFESREVAIKVLRPNIKPVIERHGADRVLAGWVEKFSADGRRLKPREVVAGV